MKLVKNNRIDGSNHENSDFGSSDGTNIHFNFPTTIHELISPGGSNCTNTKLRNSAAQTSKNFQYLGNKKDSLQEESRNEVNFFMKTGKNKTAT